MTFSAPREVLSHAFARSEFNAELEEWEFAGERADEGDRLADIALAALRAAGYSLVRSKEPAVTANFSVIHLHATWSFAISPHITGDTCRVCGTGFVDGVAVHLGFRDGRVYPYCSEEHYNHDAVIVPG